MEPSSTPAHGPSAGPVDGRSSSNGGGGWLWTGALTAGMVAGVLAWLGGEAVFERVPWPEPTGPFKSFTDEERLQVARADLINAALAFGILGALLGMALGLAGGLVRRRARSAIVAAGVGLVVGGVVAVGATAAVMPVHRGLLQAVEADDLRLALGTHIALWATVGAAGGLAWGLGLGPGDRARVARATLGGLLGAVAGSVLLNLVGSLLFPLDATHRVLSASWRTRLLARLLVATLTAAGAAWATHLVASSHADLRDHPSAPY